MKHTNQIVGAILLLTTLMVPSAFSESNIKKPNVSGAFYSADPRQLSADVQKYISSAKTAEASGPIDIVIVPHAGYFYSGAVAGYGFKAVSGQKYNTIVVLAPSHYVGFDGIAVWSEGGFETPLGTVMVDEEFAGKLIKSSPKTDFNRNAFEREHALEVEIPFLQETFKSFKIVPVVMGQPAPETLKSFAQALKEIIGERKDVLIVVSTDLSHYHDDATARKMDQDAISAIEAMDIERIWQGHSRRTMEMCGFIPVVTSLLYAKLKGLDQVDVLKYANSADASGDRERVVGYSAILISGRQASPENNESALTKEQKVRLLNIARQSVESYVQTGKKYEFKETDPRLLTKEGAFVTIHKHGRLRGCIGHIIATGPLCYLVRDMAIASATQDPRFNPLTKEELKDIDVEVSVLSTPKVVKSADEIVLGKHGVIISQGAYHHGVFLPQVADETGWSKEEFMGQLCAQKAGLPSECWKDPKTKIEIFTADVFSEKDFFSEK